MLVLIFDTETTGLPEKRDSSIYDFDKYPHVIQLSWVLYDDVEKKVIEEYDQIIAIGDDIPIPEKSVEIHGISREISRERGIPIKEALRTFRDVLKRCDIVVGHNISFDKKIIVVEGLRNKVYFQFKKKNEFCTMRNSNGLSKEKKGYLRLGELHNVLFGSLPENLHNSKIDVDVTLKCYLKLIEKS